MLALTSFEATNSVFNISDTNNTFLLPSPGHLFSRGGVAYITKLKNLIKVRSESDFELHVKKVGKKGKLKKERSK